MEIEENKAGAYIGGVSKDYYVAFFGKRHEYFIKRLVDLAETKSWSFNIGAFFFGLFWFLYHRLYLAALAIAIVIFMESIAEDYLFMKLEASFEAVKSMQVIITILSSIVLGYLANNIYLKYSVRKVAKILEQTTEDEEVRVQQLSKAGKNNGTLIVALIIIVILAVVIENSIV